MHAVLETQLARAGLLRAEHLPALIPGMRRALAALPGAAEVRKLCLQLGLPSECRGRAEMHAAVLGMSPAEFWRLAEEDSVEARMEEEAHWLAEEEW